eukprot:scaffold315115_cov14-Prasinocladus_malaysianus.AAC.1
MHEDGYHEVRGFVLVLALLVLAGLVDPQHHPGGACRRVDPQHHLSPAYCCWASGGCKGDTKVQMRASPATARNSKSSRVCKQAACCAGERLAELLERGGH